jgi:hypothetical protein
MATNRAGYKLLVTLNQIGLEVAMKKENIGKLVDLVFKAVALAMAVAVVVTNILGVMDTRGQILLVGIGLFGLAITSLDK